jgi:hypothetical protein
MRLFGFYAGLILLLTVNSAFAVNQGLVACYPFTGSANDMSGNQHHGTVYGAVSTSDRFGVPGNAYEFNGMNDYVDIGLLSDITASNEFSISVWIRPNQVKLQTILFLMPDNLSDRLNAMAYYDHNSVSTTVWDFGNCLAGGRLIQPSQSFINSWQQWVFTVHPLNGMKVYVNGILAHVTTNSSSVIDRNRKLWIGGGEDASGALFYFDGAIDDLKLFEVELTVFEISQLHLEENSCSTLNSSALSPNILSFHFNSNTGTVTFPEGLINENGSIYLVNLLGQQFYRQTIRRGVVDVKLPDDEWMNGMLIFVMDLGNGKKFRTLLNNLSSLRD